MAPEILTFTYCLANFSENFIYCLAPPPFLSLSKLFRKFGPPYPSPSSYGNLATLITITNKQRQVNVLVDIRAMSSSAKKKAVSSATMSPSSSMPPSTRSFLPTPPLSSTRSLFLRSVALCYLSAFASLYPQIAGLYGTRGVIPAAKAVQAVPQFNLPNPVQEGPVRFFQNVRYSLRKSHSSLIMHVHPFFL